MLNPKGSNCKLETKDIEDQTGAPLVNGETTDPRT
jgi:hypothetical protein